MRLQLMTALVIHNSVIWESPLCISMLWPLCRMHLQAILLVYAGTAGL